MVRKAEVDRIGRQPITPLKLFPFTVTMRSHEQEPVYMLTLKMVIGHELFQLEIKSHDYGNKEEQVIKEHRRTISVLKLSKGTTEGYFKS